MDWLVNNNKAGISIVRQAFSKKASNPVIDNKKLLTGLKLPSINSQQAIVYFTGGKRITLENLAAQVDRSNLEKHVNYLASEELAADDLKRREAKKPKNTLPKSLKNTN